MFDLGWTELLVIAVVALIVIGPKDLPGMFRQLGRFTTRVRGMAREFQRAMEDAADEAGVKDVSKDLRNITNPRKMGMDTLKDATKDLSGWRPDTSKPGAKAAKAADGKSEKTEDDATRAENTAADKPDGKSGAPASEAGSRKDEPASETEKLSQKRAEDAERAQTEAAARRKTKAREEAPTGQEEAPPERTARSADDTGDTPKSSAKGNS